VPVVEEPLSLADVTARVGEFDAFLVAWEQAEAAPVSDPLSDVPYGGRVALLVGPEGGLTSEEVETLSGAGASVVRLGETVLRSETAGIVLCALTVYEMGGLGGRSRG
jgi:16S rRNA (uracil1498-N3)-methyltransferase